MFLWEKESDTISKNRTGGGKHEETNKSRRSCD